MPEIKPRLATCKASTLPDVLLVQPTELSENRRGCFALPTLTTEPLGTMGESQSCTQNLPPKFSTEAPSWPVPELRSQQVMGCSAQGQQGQDTGQAMGTLPASAPNWIFLCRD